VPFLVSSPDLCSSFPESCSYCGAPAADSSFRQPYSKMALSKIPGRVESKNWKIELPACEPCAKWFTRTRVILFASGWVAGLAPFLLLFVPQQLQDAACWLWGLVALAWCVLLVLRRYRLAAFRVGYVGNGEVVYTLRDERLAQEFALRNNLNYERRALLVRTS